MVRSGQRSVGVHQFVLVPASLGLNPIEGPPNASWYSLIRVMSYSQRSKLRWLSLTRKINKWHVSRSKDD